MRVPGSVRMVQDRNSGGLTAVGYRLVLAIAVLSLAHHIDHVLRGVTGWPFAGGFNAFSGSLFVYPVIALGMVLARRGLVGPGFWVFLAGGGAVFILVVHVGPAAGDDIARIPNQYDSTLAGAVALVVLAAFFAALVAHCIYELRLLRR
jgi:hypothetical protein